jgi:PKD repeat protein
LKQLLLVLLLCLFKPIYATHLVGGEMTYKYLGANVYEVKLSLFIDCYNGSTGAIASDATCNFAVFEGNTGNNIPSLCKSVQRDKPVRVSKTNYNCIKIAPNACVDAYDYVTQVTLPPRTGGYIISFQRCCRNGTLINIVSPLNTGGNFWTAVNDTTGVGYNTSPVFKNLPPNFLCANAPLTFDHSATDADGDSLVYEFFQPYSSKTSNVRTDCSNNETPPFAKITYESGYTFNNAIPSSPASSLDPKTGILRITPTMQGQFVVGIMVKEYRKGKLIGSTKRDYQFNVQNCVFETTSAFISPSINCNREVTLANNSKNATSYAWDFGDTSIRTDTSSAKVGYYKYKKAGVYLVTLKAFNGSCYDSISKWITVVDRLNFKLPDDIFICKSFTLNIHPDTFYRSAKYLWSNGSTDSNILVNSIGTYWVNVQVDKCSSNDTIEIKNDVLGIGLKSDTIICEPVMHEFVGKLRILGSVQNVEWFFNGELTPFNSLDTLLSINKKGKYCVRGIKTNNCPFQDTIDVLSIDGKHQFKLGNVFTPNNDGVNDVFPEPSPNYLYKLWVFDRWGMQVFYGEDQAWDAKQFADGNYYFFIEMEACGAELNTHGIVRVIH